MTRKLYDEDAYQKEFKAMVVNCIPCKKGYDVILDQTLFFPEEGGQTCDRGTLNGVTVLDVQIIDQEIHHYTNQPLQGQVTGKIDYDHRYHNMQNHSGEHVLSGIIKSLYGLDNNGFHLSDHEITTDYNGMLNEEQLKKVEQKANQIIQENHPIHSFYPQDPSTYQYRSKKEINEAIRLVEIEGVDCCACCAPHVKSTSEIGVIKILKAIKNKKGVRIYFICGQRAYQDYKVKHDQAMYLSKQLSLPPTNLIKGFEHLFNENQQLKQELSLLKKKLIDQEIKSLSSKPIQIQFKESLEKPLQQYLINQLSQYSENLAVIFVGKEAEYQFMMMGNHAIECLQYLKEHFDIKGGGKDIVQGKIVGLKENIIECIEEYERGK